MIATSETLVLCDEIVKVSNESAWVGYSLKSYDLLLRDLDKTILSRV